MRKQAAIDLLGSVKALSEELRISREAIYQWGDMVPEKHWYRLSKIGVPVEPTIAEEETNKGAQPHASSITG